MLQGYTVWAVLWAEQPVLPDAHSSDNAVMYYTLFFDSGVTNADAILEVRFRMCLLLRTKRLCGISSCATCTRGSSLCPTDFSDVQN